MSGSRYWGMPITNVQSCRAGHAEYPHLNLPHFLIDRQAPLMVGLLVVGVAPRLLGLSAGLPVLLRHAIYTTVPQ